jgi:hypothetical protein
VTSYTVNGTAGGTFKNVGNLSWLRVFGAGHEVPYYQPAVALQVFTQTMQKKAIFSTELIKFSLGHSIFSWCLPEVELLRQRCSL